MFDIHAKIDVGRNEFLKRSRNYTISVDKHKDCVLILKAVKLLDSKEFGLVLQNTCCKRAYIRGAFQAAGSMSDPEKNYHFEVVSTNVQTAEQLKEVLNFFDLDAERRIKDCRCVEYYGSTRRIDGAGECKNPERYA